MCCDKALNGYFLHLQVFEVFSLLQMHLCQTRILVLFLEEQRLVLVSSYCELKETKAVD
jgi:hypothetical protein